MKIGEPPTMRSINFELFRPLGADQMERIKQQLSNPKQIIRENYTIIVRCLHQNHH